MMRKLVAVVLVIVAMALAACTSSPKVSPASTTTTAPTEAAPGHRPLGDTDWMGSGRLRRCAGVRTS